PRLAGGQVHLPSGAVFGIGFTPISNHADHARIPAGDFCNAANRVLPRPQFPRHRFVDDNHWLAFGSILPTDVAAPKQAHTYRLEVAGRNDVDKGALKFPTVIVPTLGSNSPTAVPAHRQVVRNAH